MSIQSGEILETVKMVADQNFDVRTITIGIDLHDCISSDINVLNQNIYNKITTVGKDLVATAKYLSAKYGVPIVNQRISVTPIAQIAAATKADSYVSVAQTLDKAAKAIGVSFIGGFSALVQKGMSPSDEVLIRSIPEAMKTTDIVCSSINIGSTRAGINMDAVKLAGETIKRTAEITPEGFGCAKIVVFCNAVEDNPFMAGAFHGSGEADAVINVGVSGPGVVKAALENSDATTLTEVAEVVKKTAFKITRVGELIGREASKMLNIPFGILDLRWHRPPPSATRWRVSLRNGLERLWYARHDGCLGIAERCREKRRHDGFQRGRRPERRVYSRFRRRRYDCRRRSRRADAGQTRSHDCRLLRWFGHDCRPRRYARTHHFRYHRRRSRHRHDQQQNHRRAHHSGNWKNRRRQRRVWRPVGLRACNAG